MVSFVKHQHDSLFLVTKWNLDAERAADDGGMLFSHMDLSYLGVHAIWTNNMGEHFYLA